VITVPALQLRIGDRIEGREEVRRVGWYLDPDDEQAPAQVLVTDTAGREYLFDRADRVEVIRTA
jgi:hypothetical protein